MKSCRNQKDRIFFPYLDIWIVFDILMGWNAESYHYIPISKEMLNRWRLDQQTLFQVAKENTEMKFPYLITSLQEMVEKQRKERRGTISTNLYVLSNKRGMWGSIVMLYEKCLEEIGECLGEDFFLLPSSVHEMILVPKSTAPSPIKMQRIVKDINEKEVSEQDVLSDEIYYYDRSLNEVILW